MDTVVRNTPGLIEEFAKIAHDAVDVLHDRAVALNGNMENLMAESNMALGAKFVEGTKLGNYIQNNPSKAALYSFMTAMMFTHFMKAKGINVATGAPGVTEVKGETSKPRSIKVKAKARAA